MEDNKEIKGNVILYMLSLEKKLNVTLTPEKKSVLIRTLDRGYEEGYDMGLRGRDYSSVNNKCHNREDIFIFGINTGYLSGRGYRDCGSLASESYKECYQRIRKLLK
jgi:hypothetical protein